ncbi:cytochrome c3 family protein [Sabulicella glaciei]|uniref:Cytochrome c family protein n=1 Tax=Sabulicella glaciei TaxID=2984948 RepID=A0ABT3NRI7_9PROT|nr:cytochrome c3 family protein [Roseococcus sp. MDT2-1-1]MCW8084768.1 cytochrome c family protein [Roseococcus sp. MDT2-1-1]
MAPIFTPRADARLRLVLVVAALLAVLALALGYAWARSGSTWAVGKPAEQPIPFSHAIHAGQLGLDCGFCHSDAARGAGAGMPAGELCLGCHQRVWNVTAQFAPIQAAVDAGLATQWASVHRLPDHVRFHHAAHLAAGVTCATCHGAVETMPRTVRAETLSMGWCLDCHRDPQTRGLTPVGLGAQPYVHAGIEVPPLTRCTVCHK